jgi:hypothetical protein
MRTSGKKQMMVHSDGKEFLVDLIGSYFQRNLLEKGVLIEKKHIYFSSWSRSTLYDGG